MGMLLALAAWVLLGTALSAQSQPAPLPEYDVKAACLYNFIKFTDWPPEAFSTPADPIRLGILGPDPFGPVLERLVAGKTLGGRSIQVIHSDRAEELKNCHLVFISASEIERPQAGLMALQRESILTVADVSQPHSNTVITFFIENRKVAFTVNLEASRRARIRLSSKLLNLARNVRAASPGGAE